ETEKPADDRGAFPAAPFEAGGRALARGRLEREGQLRRLRREIDLPVFRGRPQSGSTGQHVTVALWEENHIASVHADRRFSGQRRPAGAFGKAVELDHVL